MAIKLEVGKRYELNNGEVHECTDMYGDDPLAVDDWGYGPFVIDGYLYHQDGRWAVYSAEDALSVKRCVDDDPQLWRDMTPEEKGALLLAHHDGKVIELYDPTFGEWVVCSPGWAKLIAYRVKPEPVLEAVVMFGYFGGSEWVFGSGPKGDLDTHRITFNAIDGVPDCASVKMEEL